MTIKEALRDSKNTVSVQIMDKLTPAASLDFLRNRLGIESLIDSDADYAALALGQPHYGITVREMAQAYCALSNDGTFTKARTYTMVKDRSGNIVLDNRPQTQQAFSTETARTMTYMLNYAATYGTGHESRLSNMPVAGKTGTTSDNKDRWFLRLHAVLHLRSLDGLRHAREDALQRQPRSADLAKDHGGYPQGSQVQGVQDVNRRRCYRHLRQPFRA